jgi:hypothetical protein
MRSHQDRYGVVARVPATALDEDTVFVPALQGGSDQTARRLFELGVTPNDMLDFRHAALAIPYCDAVFCDGPMAVRLRSKPCQFGQVFGTKILGRPAEIIEYLSGCRRL